LRKAIRKGTVAEYAHEFLSHYPVESRGEGEQGSRAEGEFLLNS